MEYSILIIKLGLFTCAVFLINCLLWYRKRRFYLKTINIRSVVQAETWRKLVGCSKQATSSAQYPYRLHRRKNASSRVRSFTEHIGRTTLEHSRPKWASPWRLRGTHPEVNWLAVRGHGGFALHTANSNMTLGANSHGPQQSTYHWSQPRAQWCCVLSRCSDMEKKMLLTFRACHDWWTRFLSV